jgi:hypothetical protein
MAKRRYNPQALAPEDAVLELDGREYPIPDALTIPMMQKFMLIAKELEAARAGEDDVDAEAAVEAMNNAHQAILDYVRLRTPDANFQLDVHGIIGTIGFIVGHADGPEAEVLDAFEEAGATRETAAGEEDEETVRLDDDPELPPTPPQTP